MTRLHYTVLFLFSLSAALHAQPDIKYYLPENVSYNPAIPLPKSVIGHEVGEWHVTHDKLVAYMEALDKASDRISMEVTGYTHEGRPLLILVITAPENHAKLEQIRTEHLRLTDPGNNQSLNVRDMPIVFYMGYSIHGNESSGSNASLLAAYHLAAAEGAEINTYLKNTIVLLDPSFNPDGLQRFSGWVNARKSKITSEDPYDTEHNEAWPGGRFNHYWFDLNRDWLVAQHPESQARLKTFHRWKPNVLTDHHEMGPNSTFFFQPGVPSRMHPLTPEKNLELTRKIGNYHGEALDQIGSLYYTQEGYDDFYYGKGSTFPDIQGAIGILFEQASSRGHAQETQNGILRFEFTIRNQFTTSLSSLKAVNALREELLSYQLQFFRDAIAEAGRDPVKAIIFGSAKDPQRTLLLAEAIARQDIQLYTLDRPQSVGGRNYEAGSSYVVPLNQRQYRLIKSMFEKRTQFKDSLFYDISSWTLPLAFGVNYDELKAIPRLVQRLEQPVATKGKRIGDKSNYAYAFETFNFNSPGAVYELLKHGVHVKVASEPFTNNGRKFERGTVVIPLGLQEKNIDQIEYIIDQVIAKKGVDVFALPGGLDYGSHSLGSASFLTLKKPSIAMIVGDGISPTDVGEVWHLLDVRHQMPVTLLPHQLLTRANLAKYNTIILPPSNGTLNLSEQQRDKLKTWVQNGGVMIGLENAVQWFNANGFGKFELKKEEETAQARRPYAFIEQFKGAQETSGAIFNCQIDPTHPLFFGYTEQNIPMFKPNNLFLEKSKNPYANPATYSANPLLSGYISKENYNKLKDSSVSGVSVLGQGRVIGFTDNLYFRAFWLGTSRILTNAIFYGHFLDTASGR